MTNTEIVILRGYSSSGKSTYAAQNSQDAIIVSRDSIRAMLTGSSTKQVLDYKDETLVTEIQETTVKAAIRRGVSVIIDDTNLVLRYARRWANLAQDLGVTYHVIDFKVEADECMSRNAWRGNGVNREVIESQAKRFPIKNWQPIVATHTAAAEFKQYIPDTSLPTAFSFDLDGTLAHMDGNRSPYDPTKYHMDSLDTKVAYLANVLWNDGHQIIVFSGRSEDGRKVTEKWLIDNGVVYNKLIMRKSGDARSDDIVKSELFDEYIAPRYNLLGMFDDRDRVIKALRAKGIKVYQVSEGAF